MDMQKLFSLISRVADMSSALTIPHHAELVDMIKDTGEASRIYEDKEIVDCIDTIRNSQYSTVSEKRSMTELVLRRVIVVLCEEQGIDLMYRYPNQQRTLHVGLVIRETHTGTDAVYGIRDCDYDGSDSPVWEFLPVADSRMFDAIQWRMRDPRRISVYGWADPIYINKPYDV